MTFVTDIRRAGIELDIHDFVRALRRRARWYLPKGAPKAAVHAAVTRCLAEGDVAMPPGLEFPPYLVIVGVARHFGSDYCWRCPGCWHPRRFLYSWPGEWVWRCRHCWRLRYLSQAWPWMSPLWREIAGQYELDIIGQQRHAHVGRVGRPPTRKLRRLAAQEQRWWERISDALERASIELGRRRVG
jgi:hypothetical protein